jgi:hypothetical protein
MNVTRNSVLAALLLLGLAGLAAASYARLADSRGQAIRAVGDTAECRWLAASIEALHAKSAAGTPNHAPAMELTTRILQAAQSAGISEQSIDRTDAQSVHRAGDSAFTEHPADIEMHDVTLRQAIAFLHSLCAGPAGLRIKDLRLTAPHGSDTSDRWSFQVTAAEVVYAPKRESP